MSREDFIQDILNHLLTEVDPQVLAVMASDGRETCHLGSVGGLMGGQNLNDPQASLYVMLSDAQRAKFRETFASRYRRMIMEFIELKEKLLHHQKIPESEFKTEIINYITRSDATLGMSIYQVAANHHVTEAINAASREALLDKFDPDRIQSLSDRAKLNSLKMNVNLTSAQCTQLFSVLKTSAKGMVQLIGSGKPFIFEACHIAEILPCHKTEPRNDFGFIYDTIRTLAGQDSPGKTVYTAIRMKGKYTGVNFIEVSLDAALPKLEEAIRISNAAQVKRYGEFK